MCIDLESTSSESACVIIEIHSYNPPVQNVTKPFSFTSWFTCNSIKYTICEFNSSEPKVMSLKVCVKCSGV